MMMTTKNNSRPRSPQQKMSSLTGSKNAKIMNLTSYIFSGFFQNKSSSNSNENEVRSAPEQRDAYKIHSKRSSGETVIGKSRVQQAIAYQDNPNTNFAMNVSGPSNRSVLSTSRPDGTIQAKNIRSVKVSQSASSHMKHSIPIAGSAASSPSNSSHGHSSNLNNNINKPLFSQNKVVHPSISVNDHDDRSVNSITVTRKSSSVPIGSFLSTTTTNSSSSTNITVATATTTNAVKKVLCCDKCDGKHETDDCPYYKKKREDHPDAQRNSNHKMGGLSLLPGSTIMRAKVVKQPGDGSCLFHSMCYGLGTGINASRLRSEICSFIQNNPDLKISDTPLKDWVRWDSGASVSEYARTMSRGSWGGGIEMACFSQLKNCNVHVYERSTLGFKRISAFDHPDNPQSKPVVRVLYCGGIHYDALVVNS